MPTSNEKQKMLSGQWYFSSDRQLTTERQQAKSTCYRFNQHAPDQRKAANRLLANLFADCSQFWIEAPFYCDYGYNIRLGSRVYANHGVTILDAAPVTLGDNCLLGPGVIIATASHHPDPVERAKGLCIARPIIIGKDVWIGMGAKILPGVTIGDAAIIAAGAVVSKDVATGTTVAGVPARVQAASATNPAAD